MFNAGLYCALQREGNTSKNQFWAAKAILAGVCDAVAEPDVEFKFVQLSQGLAAVLLPRPSRRLATEQLASPIAADLPEG